MLQPRDQKGFRPSDGMSVFDHHSGSAQRNSTEEFFMSSHHHVVSTKEAPAAIGPYSQAIDCGGMIFCSGQIPLDPNSGELVSGDICAQTKQVLQNLTAVLRAAGCDPSDIVKTTIFLTDLGDFSKVNELYGQLFPSAPPARSTIQVAALPKGSHIEIEAIAKRHSS